MQISKTVLIIIVLISIYVVFLIFSDIEKTYSIFISIDKTSLFIGIGFWLVGIIPRLLRWNFFLNNITKIIPFKQSSLYFLSGFAFILSPARAGEIIRSPFIKRDYGISISKTASIVLVERFYDILAITILVSIGIIFSDFEKMVVILPLGLVCAILVIFRSKTLLKKTLKKLSKIKIFSKILPDVDESYDVISSLIKTKFFLLGISTSIFVGFMEVLGVYFFIIGLGGSINFNDLLVIFHSANFVAGVSMIPGGIGVFEGGLVGLLVLYKIEYEVALSVTVLVRIVSTGVFSAIGLICLRFVSQKRN